MSKAIGLSEIRAALKQHGYCVGRRIPYQSAWKLKTPGWNYCLVFTDEGKWVLKPENTSPRYRQLCRIITDTCDGH
jgi:hypothetical protein